MITGMETFAQVRALHYSAGEPEAAAGRIAQLARKAGMTVAEALSMLHAPPSAMKGGKQLKAEAFDYYLGRGTPDDEPSPPARGGNTI